MFKIVWTALLVLGCTGAKYHVVVAPTVTQAPVAVSQVTMVDQEPSSGYMGLVSYVHVGPIAPPDGTLYEQLRRAAAAVGANRIVRVNDPVYAQTVRGLTVQPLGFNNVAVRPTTWPTYTGYVLLYRVPVDTTPTPRCPPKRTCR